MPGPLLELNHLALQLNPSGNERRQLLTDVTFAIEPGEAVGLVGESGSGKSITARTIIQLLPPNMQWQGDIKFDGESIRGFSAPRMRGYRSTDVQIIFQDPRSHINPVRSLGDYLTEALRYERGMSRAEADERVIAILKQLGVSDAASRLKQYPHQLSGGQLQRTMIASALAADARLLIADEATTALDVTTQADLVALLDQLRKQRRLSLLFITHDLELAGAICDRIVVIYAGMVVEDQMAPELLRNPRHPYSAGLLLSRPSVKSKTHRLVAIPGRPISAHDAPEGCPFAPRCSFKRDSCEVTRPVLTTTGAIRVACSRSGDLPSSLITRTNNGSLRSEQLETSSQN